MAEHKFLVVLRERTEVPLEAVVKGDENVSDQFLSPWHSGWQEKSGFPKPPMEVHNSSYDGTQLQIHFKGQMLRVSTLGEVCVDPDYSLDLKKIKEMVGLLPALWKWGQNVRRSQDEIFARIVALMPVSWEITLPENERSHLSEETLREIVPLLEKFKQAGEAVPERLKSTARGVIRALEHEWQKTETCMASVKKWREEENKKNEWEIKRREEKNETKKNKTKEALQKAGLI